MFWGVCMNFLVSDVSRFSCCPHNSIVKPQLSLKSWQADELLGNHPSY